MGNKLKFLFEYNYYINNLNNLTNIDDKKIYEKSLKNILIDGLIKTYPLEKSINIIKKRFSELVVKKETDGEILITGRFDKLEKYLPLITNLGYFISCLITNGENWIKNYNNETIPLALLLEPKYDIEINPIPKIMYHMSPVKIQNKISKIGFIPKTGNKLSNHPDRIYLIDNLDIAYMFGENIKKETNQDYNIYKINMSKLKINLYCDINLKNGGFYTTCNIPPSFFEKIK